MKERELKGKLIRLAHEKPELRGRILPLLKRVKTAGEVRFVKDRSGDKNEWGWGTPPPQEREISSEYEYDPKSLKPLAKALRATLSALGHAMSGYTKFTKIKSATVSPDGSLGGKGYIQRIPDMRRQYMNCIEALSSISDTLYDEVNAPHWDPAMDEVGSRERNQVKHILEDAEEIKDNPKGWAQEEEAQMGKNGPDEEGSDPESAGVSKMASKVAASTLVRDINIDARAVGSIGHYQQKLERAELSRIAQRVARRFGNEQ